MQTSTVTVAVLGLSDSTRNVSVDERDLDITTSRGSGPGGQHRNKTDSCVTIVHRPTGTSARVDMKSQHQSREIAMQILRSRLQEQQTNRVLQKQNDRRRQQVGSGMRGDKIRTYRTQDDRVTDHRTGQIWKLRKWMQGNW